MTPILIRISVAYKYGRSPLSLEMNSNQKHPDFMDFIRGFIPYNLPIFLRQHLDARFTNKEVNDLVVTTQSYTSSCFKTWVWNFRNDALKLYQTSLGNTKRSLKVKFRDRNRSLDIPSRAPPRLTSSISSDKAFLDSIVDNISDWIEFGLSLDDVL